MAVTLDDLALHVLNKERGKLTPRETADLDSLLAWSTELVDQYLSGSTVPDAIRDAAIRRCAFYDHFTRTVRQPADGGMLDAQFRLGRPQSSWTRIKGESDVTRRWGYGSVEAGEGSWVGADGGSPEGDRSRRRRGGDGVGGLGAGTTVEREPETGCGVAAAA